MNHETWTYVDVDVALFSAIARVWEFAERTCARRFPPGVYKHRSIEEMDALRETWDEANFRAFHDRRSAKAKVPPR
jgi:hypothetical protein